MNDIVLDLRSAASDFCADGPIWPGDLLYDAADEIERLRAELSRTSDEWLKVVRQMTEQDGEVDRLRARVAKFEYAGELALQYWAVKWQRYKNRHPVWVVTLREALEDKP